MRVPMRAPVDASRAPRMRSRLAAPYGPQRKLGRVRMLVRDLYWYESSPNARMLANTKAMASIAWRRILPEAQTNVKKAYAVMKEMESGCRMSARVATLRC